jgi:hypothetical protein
VFGKTVGPVLERARNRARRPLARTPFLFDALIAMRPDRRSILARRDSILVIEGFPRSANTYSLVAFLLANGDRGHIGHHLHAPGHVARAVRFHLPTIVLIRDPKDACLSYVIRRPAIPLADALCDYLDFYRSVWPLRERFVIGDFRRVVTDMGSVIRAVNDRFSTQFVPYEHTPENEQACVAMLEQRDRSDTGGTGFLQETYVARPSAYRAKLKQRLEQEFEQGRTRSLLERTDELYRRFLEAGEAAVGSSKGRLARPEP